MNTVSIVSYPSVREDSLLSLTDVRSRYMVPFGGSFRTVDFTLRNAASCDPEQVFIFGNVLDDTEIYVEQHPLVQQGLKTKVILDGNLNTSHLSALTKGKETDFYVLYCGDQPGMIDFQAILSHCKKKKNQSVLFQLQREGARATMAHTILVTNRTLITRILQRIRKENRQAPNIFNMLINMLINEGIRKETFNADFWTLGSVSDYYDANFSLMGNRQLFGNVFGDPLLKHAIATDQPCQLGPYANVRNSFISEGCILDGRVEQSIIFPGVIVARQAAVAGSILLPHVAIGPGARVTRTVIDEYTDFSQSHVLFNVGEKCYVGTDEPNLRNNDYPRSLNGSVTLIGKNCALTPGMRIGAACFVASASSASAFGTTRTLDDGLSIGSHNFLIETA